MSKDKTTLLKRILKVSMLVIIILFISLSALLIYAWINRPLPLPPDVVDLGAPWEKGDLSYSGDGRLLVYMGEETVLPKGSSVEILPPFYSGILAQDRAIIVYLPPGYNKKVKPYPVIFALHGNAGRCQTLGRLLIDPLEDAMEKGIMPSTVVIFPDFSISGDGRDSPQTPYDDRLGSRYINSNLGRFEDHFFQEIVPFVRNNFNVMTDPDGIVMLGASMGGFGVVYSSIKHPDFSHILVPIYPSVDMRYSIDGDRLADYDPEGYSPLNTDDPDRIVNGSIFGGLLGITEEWMYYPVFDSDKSRGEVWEEDLPVWERMKMANPVDMLIDNPPDLTGQRYYIIAGSRDEFNLDDAIKVLIPLLRDSGAEVDPEENIIPGGQHDNDFITDNIDEIFIWIGKEIKSNRSTIAGLLHNPVSGDRLADHHFDPCFFDQCLNS